MSDVKTRAILTKHRSLSWAPPLTRTDKRRPAPNTKKKPIGFKLVGLKLYQTPESVAKEHYKDLASKPFYPALVEYIVSGPVVAMVWEGDGVVASARKLIGATNPLAAEPGTIRGDLAVEVGRNVVHGSDSPENGERETGEGTVVDRGAREPLRPPSLSTRRSPSLTRNNHPQKNTNQNHQQRCGSPRASPSGSAPTSAGCASEGGRGGSLEGRRRRRCARARLIAVDAPSLGV